MKNEFRALLRKIADRYPSQKALADEIGLSQSRLGRAIRGTRGEETISVLSCLRLARVSGENASLILKLADKADVANVIEELYGRGAEAIEPADRDLLAQIRALSTTKRALVQELLAVLSEREKPGPKGHGARSSTR